MLSSLQVTTAEITMKKSAFFDFFNNTDASQFNEILQIGIEDQVLAAKGLWQCRAGVLGNSQKLRLI